MTLEEIQNKIQLATEEQINGNYLLSIAHAEEILNSITISETTDLDFIRNYIISLRIQEKNYGILGDKELQFSKNKEALRLSEKYNIPQQIGNSNNGLALYYSSIGESEKALEHFEKALFYFEKIGSKIGIGSVFHNIATIYRIFGENDKALEFLGRALLLFEEINHKEFKANALSSIGGVFFGLSDYTKALEYFTKSLYIYEEIAFKVGISHALENIAHVYNSLFDISKALEYYEKSLQISKEIGSKERIASNIHNIGTVYVNLLDYTRAIEYYEKSLHINEEIGNKNGIADNLGNIGAVYKELSEYQKALKYCSNSLQIFEENGNKKGIASNLVYIGSIYTVDESPLFNVKKAEDYLQNALKLAEEIGEKEIIKGVYEKLHTLRLNQEQYKEALELHLKSVALEKEILSNEAKKQADSFHIQRKLAEQEIQMAEERGRLLGRESILRNILPDSVTDRLVNGENPIADHFETASVLFMDLVGFTTLATIAPPKQLVYLLDAIFQKADEVVETYGLEKIKTIGDGYLAVANVTSPLENHQHSTALAALQLLETMRDFVVNIPSDLGDTNWIENMKDIEIRIGIHTGEVVAGIIGKNKYTYDLWGDAVNIASRMESNSKAGRIHISEEFAKSIEQYPEFSLIPRGIINIKGKGTMNTFWLEKAK